MRKTTLLLLISCLFATGVAFGQDTVPGAGGGEGQIEGQPGRTVPIEDQPWHLLLYAGIGDDVIADINTYIRAGFLPVGMEINPEGGLSVLVVQSGGIEIEGWIIHDYTDWNQLEAEITASIREGFVPMDISRFGQGLAVLWVETDDIPVDGWRISTSQNNVTGRTRTLNQFQDQGFTLWGLSEHEGLAWFLFIKRAGLQPLGTVSGFSIQAEQIAKGILTANAAGWVPNGLAVSDQNYFVCFIR